jgi:hypothetical protein
LVRFLFDPYWAEPGLIMMAVDGGHHLERNSCLSAERFASSVVPLARLNNVTPVQSINQSHMAGLVPAIQEFAEEVIPAFRKAKVPESALMK